MPPLLNAGLVIALIATTLLAVVDLLSSGLRPRVLAQLSIALIGLAMLYFAKDFPVRGQAFGAAYSVESAIGLMLIGVILGMAAHYAFSRSPGDVFSWLHFARPFTISPIVLLPLIGTLDEAGLEPLQLASVLILAFQNGFFWQQVLKDAKPGPS